MELTGRPDEAERTSGVAACRADTGSRTEEAEDTERTDRHNDDERREEAAQPSQERRPTFFNKLPFEANEVVPGLWLGDYSSACKKDELKQRGITHVLCVCKNAKFWFPEDFVYHRVTIMDAPSEDVVSHFPECIEFIESALLNGGAVFVHCMAGVSRSASVVVAYLMYARQIKLDCALKHVRAVRPFVNPNPGFQYQLVMFQKMECDLCGNTKAHKEFKSWLQRREALRKEREGFTQSCRQQ
ncbi:tyrosine protein phosphatase yvh1 [Balamuthia mandrillaris]